MGDIDLENAKLIRAVEIADSRIEGAIELSHAHTDSPIAVNGSLIVGGFNAAGLHGESDLSLGDGASFKRWVNLNGAKIDGLVDMTGASVNEMLGAGLLQVGGSLLIRSEGRNKARFQEVILSSAGNVVMVGASFGGPLLLRSAKITEDVLMTDAYFGGLLYADHLQVGGDLFMRGARCADNVFMAFARVSGSLDLRGAALADLDLSDALIAGHLVLGEVDSPAIWKGKNGEPGTLNLRNTHIGNLADGKDAWPQKGHLSSRWLHFQPS